jgi:hypothetical protein
MLACSPDEALLVVGSLEASPRLNCEHTSSDKAYIFLPTTIHQVEYELIRTWSMGAIADARYNFDCSHAEGTGRSGPAAPLSIASEMPCHSREGIDEETASHQLSRHARCIFSLSMTKAQSLAALIGAVRVARTRTFLNTGQL